VSFRPKLVAAEESPAESEDFAFPTDGELPEDLQTLAAQLQSEALELGRQFPPCERDIDVPGVTRSRSSSHDREVLPRSSATDAPQQSRRFRRPPAWLSAMGGTLAAAVLVLSIVSQTWQGPESLSRPEAIPSGPRLASQQNIDRTADLSVGRVDVRQPLESTTRETTSRPTTSPALFLQEVSGPELEGLLDLMEDDGQACDIAI
jgi:hypothetical protein